MLADVSFSAAVFKSVFVTDRELPPKPSKVSPCEATHEPVVCHPATVFGYHFIPLPFTLASLQKAVISGPPWGLHGSAGYIMVSHTHTHMHVCMHACIFTNRALFSQPEQGRGLRAGGGLLVAVGLGLTRFC